MNDMIMQGTTPSLMIEISTDDLSLADVSEVELYIQHGQTVTVYTSGDLAIDTERNTITKVFTEEETASYSPTSYLTVQARFFFPGGAIVGMEKVLIRVADMIGVGGGC